MKLWIKIIKGERISKSVLYNVKGFFDINKMLEYLTEICYQLDIPRPIMLKKHYRDFSSFNHMVFKSSDFVETIDFDKLWIEVGTDKNKKSKDFYSNL